MGVPLHQRQLAQIRSLDSGGCEVGEQMALEGFDFETLASLVEKVPVVSVWWVASVSVWWVALMLRSSMSNA